MPISERQCCIESSTNSRHARRAPAGVALERGPDEREPSPYELAAQQEDRTCSKLPSPSCATRIGSSSSLVLNGDWSYEEIAVALGRATAPAARIGVRRAVFRLAKVMNVERPPDPPTGMKWFATMTDQDDLVDIQWPSSRRPPPTVSRSLGVGPVTGDPTQHRLIRQLETIGNLPVPCASFRILRRSGATGRSSAASSSSGVIRAASGFTVGVGAAPRARRNRSWQFRRVLRAWEPRLQREVALELLDGVPVASEDAVVAEARLLAQIRHDNVVTVFGADCFDGKVGFWMEYVEGRTLWQMHEQHGTFSAQEALLVAIELCRALAAVHRAGLVHGDVKAQNVMRQVGGRIVLTDFGAARLTEMAAQSRDLTVVTPLLCRA